MSRKKRPDSDMPPHIQTSFDQAAMGHNNPPRLASWVHPAREIRHRYTLDDIINRL